MKSTSSRKWLLMKYASREFLTFIAVGLANTALSYLLYVLLMMILPYTLSFSLAYVSGIALSYGLNSRLVFREPLSWRKGLWFPALYALLYAISVMMLWVLVEGLIVHPYIAPLIVMAANVPLSFFLCRLVIKGK